MRIRQLVCSNGQIMASSLPDDAPAPSTVILPMLIANDTRFFADKGKIIRPFVKIRFEKSQTIEVAGNTIEAYAEVSREDFDPTDMVLLTTHSLAEEEKTLNEGLN